jgi:hypothetical protein
VSDTDEQLEPQVKAVLNAWAEEGTLSPDKLDGLLRPVRRHRQTRLRYMALTSAAAAVLLLLTIPQVRVWAAERAVRLPVIGAFIRGMAQHDPMWAWAEQHDAFQAIMAEASDKGYTVRLHNVLADPTQTTLIFTVEGRQVLPTAPELWTLGFQVIADGQPMGVRPTIIRPQLVDGILVVAVETGPIPSDRAQLTLALSQVLDAEGSWKLETPVSRKPLSDMTRTEPIDQSLKMGAITLRINRIVMSPTQTVLELTGPESGFDLTGPQPMLVANGSPVPFRSGLAQATNGLMHYSWAFAALPKDVETLTLQIEEYRMQVPFHSVIPLEVGVTVKADGGWELRVESYQRDPSGKAEVTLSYPYGPADPWQPYDDWYWVDQAGVRYPLRPTVACQEADRCLLQATLSPRDGRTPTGLQADLAWVTVHGPWHMALVNNRTR